MNRVDQRKQLYRETLVAALQPGVDYTLRELHELVRSSAAAGTLSKSRETTRAYLDRLVDDGLLTSARRQMHGALVQTEWVYRLR